jgi:hypothetical protein
MLTAYAERERKTAHGGFQFTLCDVLRQDLKVREFVGKLRRRWSSD